MTVSEWINGKLHAARTLFRMIRYLSNWSEVWSAYRVGRAVPTLRFRSGLMLHHGRYDSPIATLHEVFGEQQYRRHISEPLEGVMIDLGANLGAVTIDLAKRSRGLRVYAYEPNPTTNSVLRRNIEANGLGDRVTVHDEAVGRGRGETTIWTNMHSMMVTGYSETPPLPGAATTRVPLIDLDEVIRRAGNRPVALLKIDTEGAEADTLEGAAAATLRSIGQVILEYHDTLCPNALARCKKVLEDAGFRCRIRPTNGAQGIISARR